MRSADKAYSIALMIGVGLLALGALGGAMLFIFGALSGKVLAMAASGVFAALFIAGIVVTGGTLVMGISRSRPGGKGVTRFDDVKVIARYVVNRNGETIFDETYIDPADPKLKFYVRLAINGLGSSEYHCNGHVWGQCGELMTGTAFIQGNWIGQFVRYIGAGQGSPYHRD